MRFVNLASGGLDSTLVGILAKEEGVDHRPLFVDYGQIAAAKEWDTCQAVHRNLDLPTPVRADVSGFGALIESGLTQASKDVKEDAFTPCRNLLFLLIGSAYAYQLGISAVAISLLAEEYSLFPDQDALFLEHAEAVITKALGTKIHVLAPLMKMTKQEVVAIAKEKGITGTYSCHMGDSTPCGRCISCLETQFEEDS